MARGEPGAKVLTLVPYKPARKRRRKRPALDVTEAERGQLGLVMLALWEAKTAAGMPVGDRPDKVNKTHCGPQGGSPGFIGRIRELDDDVSLLCAVVRAVVAAQGKRPDEGRWKPSTGMYANGTTICRDARWSSNLDAGRAWLRRQDELSKRRAPPVEPVKPAAAPYAVDGSDILEKGLTMLKGGRP